MELDDSTLLLSASTQSQDGDVVGNHGTWDAWLVTLRNSNATSVSAGQFFQQIKVYPNPVSDVLHLELPTSAGFQLEVLDLLGRKMPISNSKNSLGYDFYIRDLLPGIYVVKGYNSSNSFQIKFSKE